VSAPGRGAPIEPDLAPKTTPDDPRRALRRLAAGALVGLAAAATALVAPDRRTSLPEGAVAVVNGASVRAADYERALAALEADRRNPIGEEERSFVLDRLVDEELLVQRALELGLARHDRRVRNDLVSALLDSVAADAAQREPRPEELRAFYEENRDWFTEPARLRARQLWVRGPPARSAEESRARAAEAARRLRAGEPFEAVEIALGDALVAPLPDATLPPSKLAEYAGPVALEALRDAAAGAVTEPLPAAGGFQVLVLVAREAGATRPYEALEDELRAEWRRRAGDEGLRRYLAELRSRAEIRVAGSRR
jgi:hypothetical protein